MLDILSLWYNRYLSSKAASALLILLIGIILIISSLHMVLAPIFLAIFITFILEKLVAILISRYNFKVMYAILSVYLISLSSIITLLVLVLPAAFEQATVLITNLPQIFAQFKQWLILQKTAYPDLIQHSAIQGISANLNQLTSQLTQAGISKNILSWLWSFSLSSVASLITIGVYSFLVPVLVFLMLQNYIAALSYIKNKLATDYGKEIYAIAAKLVIAINNYLYGKLIEVLIVAVLSYLAFLILGLEYALLLATLCGLSVVIPYVGAIAVTIPIAIVGLSQWGMNPHFWYLMTAHFIIQLIDGYIIVPLLFAGAVNLSPLAILLAIVFFGSIWGIWGVFFAIPLAIVIRVLYKNWPINHSQQG